MMKMEKEIYESKDKHIVPFLLVQDEISFEGLRFSGMIVYFKFSPLNKCLTLINQFMSRKATPVQPKDLLDAVETFRDRIFEMKEKRYGDAKT